MTKKSHKCCTLCGHSRQDVFAAKVLNRYEIDYFFCENCGLLQTEEPYWLDEAYSDAIAASDVGILLRNIDVYRKLSGILYFLLDRNGKYLDTAGGYGILTRLMRDGGFDFYWSDPYCKNLFASGFEGNLEDNSFSAVTAIEVLEHTPDPLNFIQQALSSSGASTLIFTTALFSGTPPAPQDWWYYALDSGQHISFFQLKTLEHIASRLSLKLYSHGEFHILTNRPINPLLFKLLASSRLSKLAQLAVEQMMTSRILEDFATIKQSLQNH
jgi:Methyltransferase domain